MPLGGERAHLVGIEHRGDGRIEECGRHPLTFEDRPDPRHAAAGAVMPLADHHGAFLRVAQGNGVVIGVEGQSDGAAGALGPSIRFEAPAGPGASDDAPPRGLRPLPGLPLRMPLTAHRRKTPAAPGRQGPLPQARPSVGLAISRLTSHDSRAVLPWLPRGGSPTGKRLQ
jgi:hypothetical protein